MGVWTTCMTSNGSWCMGIKGEMSGTVCVTLRYVYIYDFLAFVFLLFVHYCNLMVCVVYWVGKWRSRGSTGMFGNLMAIYHIADKGIGRCTRIADNSSSVVDYVIATPDLFDHIDQFQVNSKFPESDHLPRYINVEILICQRITEELRSYRYLRKCLKLLFIGD